MGYALVNELVSRGVYVTAFARNREKLKRMFDMQSLVTISSGDALSLDELKKATAGNDVIFHAINFPYRDWQTKLPKLTRNVIAAAEKNAVKLAIVDNIYSYGRSNGRLVSETTRKQPHTKKGKIRLELESMYQASTVPFVIAHFPDFYGPFAENTLVHFTLSKMVEQKKAQFVGDPTIPREYLYTLDGARALVELAKNEQAYGQTWNIPGVDVI